jgi:pimeloyl-ACP methyl ester carboxylesterase
VPDKKLFIFGHSIGCVYALRYSVKYPERVDGLILAAPPLKTGFTQDLKKFDVPTLFLHGDDDQIVPIGAAALLSSKIVKNATLKIYKGAPRGMCTTLKDKVNADLLAFFKS